VVFSARDAKPAQNGSRAAVIQPSELLELADLNLFEAAREMARWSMDSEISEAFDLLLIAGPDPFPVGYANAAFALSAGEPARPQLVIEDARRFFSERKRGYTLWTRAHLDASLQAAAAEAGLSRVSDSPGMALSAPTPEQPLAPGARLGFVEDAAGARDFAGVAARSYATLGMPAEVSARLFAAPERMLRPHLITSLAHCDGEPVAAAIAILSHGIAGIYWVGTVESHRRRGLGEACTRAAGNAAFARGAAAVVLQASRQGEPIYRRMGYREITRYVWFVDMKPAG
jgi:ribosomal protein S18 acetylase RimI-like enzyme